jgi:hypothetical protein
MEASFLLAAMPMRLISLIALLLTACGDDTTVAVGVDMHFVGGFPCEKDHTCCCGPPYFPTNCIDTTTQPCSAGQLCNVDQERGGICYCDAMTKTWRCPSYATDFATPFSWDMAAQD